ncbi:hypothetical protein MLD38_034997 [Melastoma candidum]|uniref:Uncharacterized protein n=1 Tax=Melastoma candidum TaxID=119954 RepID=A0ACB9MC94_9MYRT|nr:hypothetical protein MLD38_034997 [Melastoma candidum]
MWQLLQENIGVVGMHAQLLHNDRVVIFDRTDFGMSNLSLPEGKCRYDPAETALKVDCTAHSIEYDVASNTFRRFSSRPTCGARRGPQCLTGDWSRREGIMMGSARLGSSPRAAGGAATGGGVRGRLSVRRWYATNQLLPDGRQIVIGGRRQFNYEYYPKTSGTRTCMRCRSSCTRTTRR